VPIKPTFFFLKREEDHPECSPSRFFFVICLCTFRPSSCRHFSLSGHATRFSCSENRAPFFLSGNARFLRDLKGTSVLWASTSSPPPEIPEHQFLRDRPKPSVHQALVGLFSENQSPSCSGTPAVPLLLCFPGRGRFLGVPSYPLSPERDQVSPFPLSLIELDSCRHPEDGDVPSSFINAFGLYLFPRSAQEASFSLVYLPDAFFFFPSPVPRT